MIDTHCHLLPEIDDGARSQAETIQMCRLARDDGVATIVATPIPLTANFLSNLKQYEPWSVTWRSG